MARYLVMRLSALGDVAMLLQTLYAVARTNEQHEFVLLTQPFMSELLLDPPDNVEAMAIDIKRDDGNILGLLRYLYRLRREHFDAVLDLHDVLRTKFLRAGLALAGIPIRRLHKPRRERRALMSRSATDPIVPVPPMWKLYLQVFASAALRVPETIPPIALHPSLQENFRKHYPDLTGPLSRRVRIGVAPFASSDAKTYNLQLMKEALRELSLSKYFDIYLFGGRGREQATLESWASELDNVYSVAGRLDLSEELIMMTTLRVMVSMDSANMHLASLVGTRVLSIWCCTHPAAGFLGIGQRLEDCLQPEGLPARPCSILGNNKVCRNAGKVPCNRAMHPEELTTRLLDLLSDSERAVDHHIVLGSRSK